MRDKLQAWLSTTVHATEDRKYRHQRLRENQEKRAEIIEDLKAYISEAHKDIKHILEKNTGYSLDPLEEDGVAHNPLEGYPELLPMQTLKGYFGEVFAGIVAEHFAPFGETGWKVPVYLFRFHDAAFQYLETLQQTGKTKSSVVGRTGDDCLAFVLETGVIRKVLYCEAKCTASHDSEMLDKAHQKVSESAIVSLQQVVFALKERESLEAEQWANALLRLWLKKEPYDRYDLVSYIHGQLPIRNLSWISEEKPHPAYKAKRPLETVEIHFYDVEDLVSTIYHKVEEPLTKVSS